MVWYQCLHEHGAWHADDCLKYLVVLMIYNSLECPLRIYISWNVPRGFTIPWNVL